MVFVLFWCLLYCVFLVGTLLVELSYLCCCFCRLLVLNDGLAWFRCYWLFGFVGIFGFYVIKWFALRKCVLIVVWFGLCLSLTSVWLVFYLWFDAVGDFEWIYYDWLVSVFLTCACGNFIVCGCLVCIYCWFYIRILLAVILVLQFVLWVGCGFC